jgi:hypothetical protein
MYYILHVKSLELIPGGICLLGFFATGWLSAALAGIQIVHPATTAVICPIPSHSLVFALSYRVRRLSEAHMNQHEPI